jgi:sugar phosphate isomerase/epimerase
VDFDSVALDVSSMAGPLEVRLRAAVSKGFTRLVCSASDLVSYPQGLDAAIALVRNTGVRVHALRQLRDFEGLSGPQHQYKLNVARGLLSLCRAVGASTLLVQASAVPEAAADDERIARDLAKLAMLAVPKGIDIAYQAQAGSLVAAGLVRAEERVNAADRANLGLAMDTGHLFTRDQGLEALDRCYGDKLFLVGLSDTIALHPDMAEAGPDDYVRVFPGEGRHSEALLELIRRLRVLGFHGGFCLHAANGDYAQLPADFVAERARESLHWLLGRLRHVDLPRRKPAQAALRA